MQYKSRQHWEMDFEKRLNQYQKANEQGFPISIKVGVYSGCSHNEHSPYAYQEIYDYMNNHDIDCGFEEHESGPEVLAWIAIGTAGITLAKSVVDFITAIINARTKGNLKEETILEINDFEEITSETIEKSITNALEKHYKAK